MADETVTILEGRVTHAVGPTLEDARRYKVPAGGYFSIPGKQAHWGRMETRVVLNRLANGPRDIHYLDAERAGR